MITTCICFGQLFSKNVCPFRMNSSLKEENNSLKMQYSSDTNDPSPKEERPHSHIWHYMKCPPYSRHQNRSIHQTSGLSKEVQAKLGSTLRQKVWSGIPCSCHISCTETHWSKGSLRKRNDALLHSCSQKLAILQQTYKQHKTKCESRFLHRKDLQIFKSNAMQESDTDTSPAVDAADKDTYNSQKIPKRKVKIREHAVSHKTNKDNVQTDKSDSKTDLYKASKPDEGNALLGKSSKNKNSSLKWKFRKGGLVATAVSGNKCDIEDSSSDSDPNPKQKGNGKKKKKRNCNTARKTKRQHTATKHSPKKSVKDN